MTWKALTIGFYLLLGTLLPLQQTHASPQLKDITILVPSCDSYAELWPAFFKLLFDHWPSLEHGTNQDIPIILTSNTTYFSHPRVQNLTLGEDKSWSDQVLQALPHIHTRYVLILLDDYLLTEPVNEARLAESFRILKKEHAAYIEVGPEVYYLNGIPQDVWGGIEAALQYESRSATINEGFVYKKKHSDYRIALQACIWDKSDLEWLLKPGETAWDFEIKGSVRSQGLSKPFLGTLSPFPIEYMGAVNKRQIAPYALEYAKSHGVEIIPTHLKIYRPTFRERWKAWWRQWFPKI